MYQLYRFRNFLYMKKISLEASFLINKYKFVHWFYKWNQDEEGAIVFSVMNILHFIKYKEHTIVKFGRKKYEIAPKHVTLK